MRKLDLLAPLFVGIAIALIFGLIGLTGCGPIAAPADAGASDAAPGECPAPVADVPPARAMAGAEACEASDRVMPSDGPCGDIGDCPWRGFEVCDRERIEAIFALAPQLSCADVRDLAPCWASACVGAARVDHGR